MTIELTGSSSKLVFRPLPADDPKQRQPNIALARERITGSQRIPLREGLRQTIAYFDRLLSGDGHINPSGANGRAEARLLA